VTAPTLLDKRPALHEDVLLSRPLLRGPAEVCLIKDLRSGKAFEVADKEQFLLRRLDGTRSLAEIGDEYAGTFGRRLGEGNWQQLLRLLYGRGLLAGPSTPDTGRPPTVPLVETAYRRVRPLLHRDVVLPLIATVLVMMFVLGAHAAELGSGVWWLLRHGRWLVAAVALAGLSAALHELAHGLVARHFGASVSRVSLATLHCQVDDYLYLRSRSQQVTIALAGALVNAALLVPLAVVWLALAPGSAPRAALAGLLAIGAVQALVNLVPLPPLDGYRALGHALGTTRLATESRRFLRLALLRRGVAGYPRRARFVYAGYGSAAIVLYAALLTGVLLLGRWLAVDSLGSSVVLIAIVAIFMTLAGWLARPDRDGRPPLLARLRTRTARTARAATEATVEGRKS
jgi:putative peptide zinc metalloprotease protein